MNFRDLKYLVALVDHSHFGNAAKACFVSQPALSMQIKKLEESLGVKLLERSNKSVLITEMGLEIAARARSILSQVEEVREISKQAHDPYQGEFKIGIFPTLAPYLLPLIIPPLSLSFPKVSFYLIEEQTHELIENLKQGKLHAVFLAAPVNEPSFQFENLFEEEFMLAAPRQHVLAKLKSIKQHDLDNLNLLLLNDGHCLRQQALSICEKMNARETEKFRATSLETLRHMVVANVGVTLMPKLACQVNANITYIPFDAPTPTRKIGLYWRHSTSKAMLIADLVKAIKNIMVKNKMVTAAS
jgi:LysR family hydrogen peroxide-inducible transcriptional activator